MRFSNRNRDKGCPYSGIVITVKPTKREVHTFRIGAGGAEYDYSFGY